MLLHTILSVDITVTVIHIKKYFAIRLDNTSRHWEKLLKNFFRQIEFNTVCLRGKHRQHINEIRNLEQQTNMCRKLLLFSTNLFWYLFKLATLFTHTYLHNTYISLSIVNIWQVVNLENVRKQIVSLIFHLSYLLLSCYFDNFLLERRQKNINVQTIYNILHIL